MKEILIAYKLNGGSEYSLDRPTNKIPYSMVRVSGKANNIRKLNNLIPLGEVFNVSLLEKLDLFYKII